MPIKIIYPLPAHRTCGQGYCNCLNEDINQLLMAMESIKKILDDRGGDPMADFLYKKMTEKHPNLYHEDKGYKVWAGK